MKFIFPAILASLLLSDNAEARWKPTQSMTWNIAFGGFDINKESADIIEVDYGKSAETIKEYHNHGKKVICYFSGGTIEEGRPDYNKFTAVSGLVRNKYSAWPKERWLDYRVDGIKPLLIARMKEAVSKGCDAIDVDNVDGYQVSDVKSWSNPLTKNDAIKFTTWLGMTAHELGISIGLKNCLDIIDIVGEHFEFAVNEGCIRRDECYWYKNFLSTGKPVLGITYNGLSSNLKALCRNLDGLPISMIIKPGSSLVQESVYFDGKKYCGSSFNSGKVSSSKQNTTIPKKTTTTTKKTTTTTTTTTTTIVKPTTTIIKISTTKATRRTTKYTTRVNTRLTTDFKTKITSKFTVGNTKITASATSKQNIQDKPSSTTKQNISFTSSNKTISDVKPTQIKLPISNNSSSNSNNNSNNQSNTSSNRDIPVSNGSSNSNPVSHSNKTNSSNYSDADVHYDSQASIIGEDNETFVNGNVGKKPDNNDSTGSTNNIDNTSSTGSIVSTNNIDNTSSTGSIVSTNNIDNTSSTGSTGSTNNIDNTNNTGSTGSTNNIDNTNNTNVDNTNNAVNGDSNSNVNITTNTTNYNDNNNNGNSNPSILDDNGELSEDDDNGSTLVNINNKESGIIKEQIDSENNKGNTKTIVTGVAITGSVLGAAAILAFLKKNPRKYQNIKRGFSRKASSLSRRFTRN